MKKEIMSYPLICLKDSGMKRNSFMRLLVIFDLPTETKTDVKRYRKFVKFLVGDGYLRIQFSVYSKLCINHNSAITATKRLKNNSPENGDVRYLIITENQYQNIVSINDVYSLQEKLTTNDRTLLIGGMNDENSD